MPRWEQVGSLMPQPAPAPLRGRACDLRGQLGAQATGRTPGTSSSNRPDGRGDWGPRDRPGMLYTPAAGSRAPLPRRPPLPPGRPRGAQEASARDPGNQPARWPWGSGQLPGHRRGLPRPAGGGDPSASAAWTHFFGCFSLFGLRFRA